MVREQTEAAESPQLFPVLSQLQILFENTAEAGIKLLLQRSALGHIAESGLAVQIHAGVHHFGISDGGVFRVMALDKADALLRCIKGIPQTLFGRSAMNDGARTLKIAVAGIIQPAYPLGAAEDPVSPEFVLMVDALAEGQVFQEAPAVELVPDTDKEILRQKPEKAFPTLIHPAFRGEGGSFRLASVGAQIGTFGQVGPGGQQLPEQHFHKMQVTPVVTVDKADILAVGVLQTVVSGIGQTAVFLVEDADPGIPALPAVAQDPGAVRGAVIDQEDLQLGVGLPNQAADASVQILLNILYRHNDRNQTVHPERPPDLKDN